MLPIEQQSISQATGVLIRCHWFDEDDAWLAGTDSATVEIVDIEDIPLAYLPGNATRIRAKAVGDLRDTR